MEHQGGCHCGNLRVQVRLTISPDEMRVRSCACSFCRSHGTRTVSDPAGQADFWAVDWSFVERYRFGSRTADYLLCRRCGVYAGAVCETPAGRRAVINTRCLDDRAAFVREATHPDHDGENVEDRLARRAMNWTPTVMHDIGATERTLLYAHRVRRIDERYHSSLSCFVLYRRVANSFAASVSP
jgi:hypothetical protein